MRSNLIEKITVFLKEVKVEMKKVTWPTKKETIRHTLLVLGICFVVAFFLGGLDFIFMAILRNLFF